MKVGGHDGGVCVSSESGRSVTELAILLGKPRKVKREFQIFMFTEYVILYSLKCEGQHSKPREM